MSAFTPTDLPDPVVPAADVVGCAIDADPGVVQREHERGLCASLPLGALRSHRDKFVRGAVELLEALVLPDGVAVGRGIEVSLQLFEASAHARVWVLVQE